MKGWYEEQEEYYKENTPDWTDGWDEMDENEQNEKIQDDIKESENNEDSTMIFFRNPKILPKDSWVVHFTKEDPRKIHKDLKGCGGENVGLTHHHGCKDGDLIFGLALDKVEGDTDYMNYGKNAVLVQAGQAVEAEHISDDEQYQTVFDKTSVKKSYPILRSEDKKSYEVYDTKGKLLFTQKRTIDAFKKIVAKLKSPKKIL